jgi:phosphoribosylformimino-5-aminoimidazole carboxamide ribotide isomerase
VVRRTLQARRAGRRSRHHARPGNETEARAALAAFPGGLQIGGGINAQNARGWLDAGASHVIVTSWVFAKAAWIGRGWTNWSKPSAKIRLVLDLSCRKRGRKLFCRHRPLAEIHGTGHQRRKRFNKLAGSCAEFLVHAVDVEGLCRGIDRELVEKLGRWTPIPTTYAGGANSLGDLEEVTKLGQGKVDLTIGSALDIFRRQRREIRGLRKIQPPPDNKIRRRLKW